MICKKIYSSGNEREKKLPFQKKGKGPFGRGLAEVEWGRRLSGKSKSTGEEKQETSCGRNGSIKKRRLFAARRRDLLLISEERNEFDVEFSASRKDDNRKGTSLRVEKGSEGGSRYFRLVKRTLFATDLPGHKERSLEGWGTASTGKVVRRGEGKETSYHG